MIFSILTLLCCLVIIGYIIYQIIYLVALDPKSNGYWVDLAFGIILVVCLSITVFGCLAGIFTGNSRMVHSFFSSMICIVILMIIQAIVYAVALANCANNKTIMTYIDCNLDPWVVIYPRLILIAVFCFIAAIFSFILASILKKEHRRDY